jgi:hypothetical protein
MRFSAAPTAVPQSRALAAVRRGALLAARMLDAGALSFPVSLFWGEDPLASGRMAERAPEGGVRILARSVLESSRGWRPDDSERLFAFVAAHATGWAILADLPWLARTGGRGPGVGSTASAIAGIASDFRLTDPSRPDARGEAVRLHLDYLTARVREAGWAEIWRGDIGRASRALVREVRFTERPGGVALLGRSCGGLEDVVGLVRWRMGGAWPFRAAAPREGVGPVA